MRTSTRRLTRALLAAFALAAAAVPASTAPESTSPDSTRSVYDNAGVLAPAEIADLERRAHAIHRLGHPVVVYLATKRRSYEETVDDARGLMESWDVQSRPGATDGVVVLINLRPGRPKRGTYAVVVGEKLIQGRIPQQELDAIAGEMRPRLRLRKFGEAIALALDRIERDIREGPPPPPPPSPAQRFAGSVASDPASPMNVASVAMAAFGILLAIRWTPRRRESAFVSSAADPPSELPPALAAALVNGYADPWGVTATILDLAKRGALAIEQEPEKEKEARVRLLDATVARPGFERKLWEILEERAEAGVVSSPAMAELASESGGVQEEIRRSLVERGWFDPEAPRRRRPLMLLALGLLVLTAVATVLGLLARSPNAAIGISALAVSTVVAFVSVSRVPDRTVSGDQAAAPWLGYRRHIRNLGRHPEMDLDIDTAAPYALAFGIGARLNERLRAASEAGDLPSWMGPSPVGSPSGAGFYPCWIAIHASAGPSGGGGSSGGASAGSGASGGSF